ncbi:MAG TPA: hypothetical protein VK672_01950 [Solirubrobacteraceae bacterium]|nr:hypothetical protein [Solirubrobacteraceae bacterium]
MLCAAGLIAAGCGSTASSRTASARELALQRAQLVQLSGELRALQAPVQREVTASRGAWPLLARGLPPVLSPPLAAAVSQASANATALPEPRFMTAPARLTGPTAGIAGIYEDYERLAKRGWPLTAATVSAIEGADPVASGFARQNSSLYVDAIYDAHFDLSLLGKSLLSGYQQLGGPQAFGARLSQGEVNALAAAYSIPSVRLEPHPAGAAAGG